MNFFNLFNKNKEDRSNTYTPFSLTGGVFSTYRDDQAMKLSAVYRCVSVLTDSVAQLPLKIYHIDSQGNKVQDNNLPLYHLLNCSPNNRINRYDWLKLMVSSMVLRGVGYSYIERKNNEVVGIHFLPYSFVNINQPNAINDPVTFTVQGINGIVQEKDLIRLTNYSNDGFNGVSTLYYAARCLGIATYSDKTAESFFESGANLSGILTIEGASTPKARENIKQAWQQTFGVNGNGSSVAVLESNMRYQPITINPSDSQLLESRQFSVLEICRFFNVPPSKAFDLSNTSYASVEAENLGFLTDTLQPMLSKIEIELRRKLLNDHTQMLIKFDTAPMLQADKAVQAQFYSTLVNTGIYTINEARANLDLPAIEGGDKSFIQVNLQSLERAISDNPADSQTIKEELNNNKNNNDIAE